MAGTGTALDDVVGEVGLADVVLVGDRCGSRSPTQLGSSMLRAGREDRVEVRVRAVGSQLGAVDDDPTSLCTTASPVKFVSFDTATCAGGELRHPVGAGLVTVVFESISNGVTPPSAACTGAPPGDAANVIATGWRWPRPTPDANAWKEMSVGSWCARSCVRRPGTGIPGTDWNALTHCTGRDVVYVKCPCQPRSVSK